MKKHILPIILLAILMLILIIPVNPAKAESSVTLDEINQAIEKTVNFYREQGAPNNEWVVFGLNAVGEDVNKIPYESNGQTFLDNFTLPENSSIDDYSKAIIALTSIGQDVTDFNGKNLIQELKNCNLEDIQYINTAAYALIALDAAGVEESGDSNITKNALINYLLDNQIENVWGYSWGGSDFTDIDTTAQVIIALAPYYDNLDDYPNVKGKVDTAVDWLKAQLPITNSCSLSQVIQALTAVRIDPQTWAGATNIVEDFLAYQMDDGTFKYLSEQDLNFATPQGLEALAALRDFKINGISTIYKNIQYNEKNVITLRIEGSQTDGTILEKIPMDVPQNINLNEIVQLAIDRYNLSDFIAVDAGGNIVPEKGLTVPQENQFYCVIDNNYIEGNPTVADGSDITLFLGDAQTQFAKISIVGNSINNDNNVISTKDSVYVKVEELNKVNNTWELSVGAAVYLDGDFKDNTDGNGEIEINPGYTGDLEIYAQKFKVDGTPEIVKTLAEKVSVRNPVEVTVRIEGIINETYYPDGTILPETSVEVPDGCNTTFAIKKVLDENGIGNTININSLINTSDIILKGNIQNQSPINNMSYFFNVNNDLNYHRTVTDRDSVTLYLTEIDASWTPQSAYAKVTANKYQANVGEEVVITVLKSDGGWPASWIPAPGVHLYVDGALCVDGSGNPRETDSEGKMIITLDEPGQHEIYAQKFNEQGIPEIVKTSKITVINDTKIEQLNPVESFSLDSDADVTIKITNYLADQAKEGLLIVALYDTDDNKMVNYSYVTKSIAPNSSETFTAGFAIPASGNYEVRAFLWDNWNERTPLTDTIIIPVD